jgi:Uma2 family endonuclease
MAILERERTSAVQTPSGGPRPHVFTRAEYYALDSIEAFRNKRIELIKGEIIDMAPIGPMHGGITHPLAVILEKAFGPGFTARNQAPISLGTDAEPSDPQPDVVVLVGTWRDYTARHPIPSDILLVVEISDSTLDYDRKVKAPLYASAGISEYWILNVSDMQLEVYREPAKSGYGSRTIYRSSDSVEPLHAAGASIPVGSFLP